MAQLFGIFLLVSILCRLLIPAAVRFGLVAHPGEHRQHQTATALVGGIAMFSGLSLGLWFLDNEDRQLWPVLFVICVTGLVDDRYHLPSWLRLFIQAGAAYLMIHLTGVQLTSLGSVFSSTDYQLGEWSIAITLFAVIGVVNAFNMSDGMDGLAAGLALLVVSGLIIALPSIGIGSLEAIATACLGGFLIWNARIGREQAKIFMGDGGSTLLGLLIAYFLIKHSQAPNEAIAPVTALWIMAVPLFDAVAVLLVRVLNGASPFSADRCHYHHLLQDHGLSVNQTLASILLLQGMFMVLALVYESVSQQLQLVVFLTLFAGYTFYLYRWRKRTH